MDNPKFLELMQQCSRGRRRLSDQDVREILRDRRPARVIAEDYDVSKRFIEKLRARSGSYFTDPVRIRGSSEPSALSMIPVIELDPGRPPILSDSQVRAILSDRRTLKEIAGDYGISISTVWRVRNRQYQGRSQDFRKPPKIIAKLDGRYIFADDVE